MFKKQHTQKTSTSLRNSDCRKLRASVVADFLPPNSQPSDAQALVPDGLKAAKFLTHLDEPGTLYLSADGEPLWFTLGKGSDALIPTVYTLWKLPVVPTLITPPAVIPKLIGGADLMIPGVINDIEDGTMPHLSTNALVGIAEYPSTVPIAIGRMALPSSDIKDDMKGKAVHVIHTWKDTLWQVGSKEDPPTEIPEFSEAVEEAAALVTEATDDPIITTSSEQPDSSHEQPISTEDADALLRLALLQAITKLIKLSSPGTFPIPASTFYSSHILPSRPSSSSSSPSTDLIKRSSYKKLAKFLQSAEKEGILKLKDFKGDLNIASVNPTHPDVVAHRTFKTVGDVEAGEARKALEVKAEAEKVTTTVVVELYKPQNQSVAFFEHIGKSSKDVYYTVPELRTLINEYVSSANLIHPVEPAYARLDDYLRPALLKKGEDAEFLKRDELTGKLKDHMQAWYSIQIEGKEPVIKKGPLKPITVVCKVRQGRKASTFITNFEPFMLDAEALSEELRKSCASATSIAPLPGKAAGMEVHVQGKQIKLVVEHLLAKGVPKKWIETSDLSGGKKK